MHDDDNFDIDARTVFALALDSTGTTVVVGGDFDGTGVENGGGCVVAATRDNVAALATDASASTSTWNPTPIRRGDRVFQIHASVRRSRGACGRRDPDRPAVAIPTDPLDTRPTPRIG